MKLLRLKITDPKGFRSLQAGFEYRFRSEWALQEEFLAFSERGILQDKGKVTVEIAKVHVENEFEKYRLVQDRLFESDFDKVMKQIESSGMKGGGK
jgi:hypothetical protein